MPQLNVRSYMENLDIEFKETPFLPLSDAWAEGLDDIFKDLDE